MLYVNITRVQTFKRKMDTLRSILFLIVILRFGIAQKPICHETPSNSTRKEYFDLESRMHRDPTLTSNLDVTNITVQGRQARGPRPRFPSYTGCPVFKVRSRNASPWTYRINYDARRLPRRIEEAECLCEGCIWDGREDMNLRSVPMYKPQIVHIEVPGKGCYRPTVIKVPYACYCQIPYLKAPN